MVVSKMKIGPEIADVLLEAGFEEPYLYKESRIFRLRKASVGELFSFFSPHILYYDDGRGVAGVLGSMREPSSMSVGKRQRLNEDYAITMYSANFPLLRIPPVTGLDRKTDLDWYKKIASIVSKFPNTQGELDELIRRDGDISGVRVSAMNLF